MAPSTLVAVSDRPRLIEDRAWVAEQLASGATVTAIARDAGVSRQTAHTWVQRHGLAEPKAGTDRPTPARLRALYRRHRSVSGVGDELGVTPSTAHRWLIAAGVEVAGRGKPRRARPSHDELRRLRAELGGSRALGEHLGVDGRTIRRWLADSDAAEHH